MVHGLFGPIEIQDTPAVRGLFLNGQLQGASYLIPSAKVVGRDLEGPGPVSHCAYTAGWLAAGALNPTGSGLMVGLGAGAGAIALLHSCPGIDLTVIEIDHAMAEVAMKNFPLLVYYILRGRLHIYIDDAKRFLVNTTDMWDFACADAYTGKNEPIADFIPELLKHTNSVYMNCIDYLDGQCVREVVQACQEAGKPVTEIWRAFRAEYPLPISSKCNLIITNQTLDYDALQSFIPHQDLEGVEVEEARRQYATMLANGTAVPVMV